MAKYTFQQLKDLWVQAGGDALYATMAAAVAMAESGGNPDSYNENKNGTVDRGLWQINSIHGSQSTFDPVANARSAVAISKNGTDWRPWCVTWTKTCGSGTFMGPGSPVLKYLPDDTTTTGTTGATVSNASFGIGDASAKSLFGSDTVLSWLGISLKTVTYSLLLVAGFLVMIWGIVLLILSTRTAKTVISLGASGAVPAAGAAGATKAVAAVGAAKSAEGPPETPQPDYQPRHAAPEPVAGTRRDALFAPRASDAGQRRRLAAQEDDIREGLRKQPPTRPLRRKAQVGL